MAKKILAMLLLITVFQGSISYAAGEDELTKMVQRIDKRLDGVEDKLSKLEENRVTEEEGGIEEEEAKERKAISKDRKEDIVKAFMVLRSDELRVLLRMTFPSFAFPKISLWGACRQIPSIFLGSIYTYCKGIFSWKKGDKSE